MSHLTEEVGRVIDLANLPALEPGTHPQSPAAQLHQVAVLAAILDAAATMPAEILPAVVTWKLNSRDVMHGDEPTISGQLAYTSTRGEEVRRAVAFWADALCGEAVEVEEDTYISVEAQARVSGCLVIVWTHVAKDGAQ
jgi:hypothetical protein